MLHCLAQTELHPSSSTSRVLKRNRAGARLDYSNEAAKKADKEADAWLRHNTFQEKTLEFKQAFAAKLKNCKQLTVQLKMGQGLLPCPPPTLPTRF